MATIKNIVINCNTDKAIDLSNITDYATLKLKKQQALEFYNNQVSGIRFDWKVLGANPNPDRKHGEIILATKSIGIVATVYTYGVPNQITDDLAQVNNAGLSYSQTDNLPDTSISGKTLLEKGYISFKCIFDKDTDRKVYYGIYGGQKTSTGGSWWDKIKGKLGLAAAAAAIPFLIIKLPERKKNA